jgi:hypothetical protein
VGTAKALPERKMLEMMEAFMLMVDWLLGIID